MPLTNGKNAALVWNATDTVDPDGSVQIKADFTGPAGATGETPPLAVVVDRNADGAAAAEAAPDRSTSSPVTTPCREPMCPCWT